MMQFGFDLFESQYLDLSSKKVLIGLSGGINSAALLCYLASEYPLNYRPAELHLFAVQLSEHSPDTFRFMKDCIRYAAKKFDKIRWKIRWGSVLKYFEGEHMIPHPILSPCSEDLKIIPMSNYIKQHGIDLDLVGFVRTEKNRITRQLNRDNTKKHPIAHLSDEDCFTLVKREIGWYPAIYDIYTNGKRVFKHNNCLPCKNMQGTLSETQSTKGYDNVRLYFPEYHAKALDLANNLGSYWGRLPKQNDEDDIDFGECKVCEFL